MRNLVAGRKRRLAALVGLLLCVSGGIAYATIPDSSGVYTACVLKGAGTLRLIDPANSGIQGHCTALETLVTWNAKGPAGTPGPQGDPGPAGPPGPPGPAATSSAVNVRVDSFSGTATLSSTSAGTCGDQVASVAVTVPSTGFIEYAAHATLAGNSASATSPSSLMISIRDQDSTSGMTYCAPLLSWPPPAHPGDDQTSGPQVLYLTPGVHHLVIEANVSTFGGGGATYSFQNLAVTLIPFG